jgi:hypothetical protein
MKRFTTLIVVLLSLTAGSIALAASGPGKFETKLTGKRAKTEHGQIDGTWTLDLATANSGNIKLTVNGHPKGGGKYVITGSTITITPKKGGACKTTGKYRFKPSGNTLTFTTISDTCTVRRDVLTYGQWTKIG